MQWRKIYAVLLALGSVLLATASFAAKDERADIYRASKLIGVDVESPQGEKLGDIRDLVLDPATGRIRYAVMSFGGFLGLGEKYLAIPWTALTSKAGEKGDFILHLNIDQEKLKNAPGFDKNNWPNMVDRNWAAQVYSYYGVTPYWEQETTRHTSTIGMQGMVDGPMLSATVQEIDQSAKLLKMRTPENKIVELQAPLELLSQLQAGDRVEMVIHKQEGAVPPAATPPSK